MRQHMPDVDLATRIIDDRNQSPFVAADVENGKFADLVDRAECSLEVSEVLKIGFVANCVPSAKGRFCFFMR